MKKMKTKMIGIAMAVIMIASIFGAIAPVSAADAQREGKPDSAVFDVIYQGEKVLFTGINTDYAVKFYEIQDDNRVFRFSATPGITKTVSADIAPEGSYVLTYVEDSTNKETEATIIAPKVTTKITDADGEDIESTTRGTQLKMSTSSLALPAEDVLKVRYLDPNGYETTVTSTITVANLGTLLIDTSDWDTGDYQLWISTVKDQSYGLDKASDKDTITIYKSEIVLTADNDEPAVYEDVKFTVQGPPNERITIFTDDRITAVMVTDKEKVPAGTPTWASDGSFRLNGDDPEFETNEDGKFTFVMEFNDDKKVNIEVQLVDDDEIKDDIDIDVAKIDVELIVDRTVVLGEDIELEGTSSSGTTVDIFVEGVLVKEKDGDNVDIDDGEFDLDIKTGLDADISELRTTGSVKIEVIVDRQDEDGNPIDGEDLGDDEDTDASVVIRLVSGALTAEQDDNVLTTEDEDYGISGTATGAEKVAVLVFGPKGGSQIMTDGESFDEITVDDDDTFEEDSVFTTDTDTNTGTYTTVIVTRGNDGVFGKDIEDDLSVYYAKGDVGDLTGKTASQMLEILESDLWGAAGSDDLYYIMQFKVESAWLLLDEIADVPKGEPLNITGTTNRADDTSILVSITGPSVLAGDVDKVEDGTFGVTIDTEDAAEGTYTITADDGDGNTDTATVRIGAAAPATPTPAPATPTPAPTAVPTPVPTTAPTATPVPATPTPEEPGFEALFAIGGLLAIAFLVLRIRK